MYLKKLEIFGFKSFANKTELVFEPGVTTIVGPNGCGKSNISDSIKWVLGEQSAKELRGSKMEDVIFNGTDDTQPVNLAEVSIVLSNKDHVLHVDYDEVIITRRVFRSGESEYLLNKTPVRLKDIMELLAGTGIGVSSYSIAEQGKMDRVLSARPEDRREIFEEASGITRFKAKKKEALLKLEHTENNMVRLADIITEVKRQISSIERHAQKAEKFRLEFEKLRDLDVKLTAHDYKGVKEHEDGIKQENDALKQKEAHLSLELNLQQDELRIHREKIEALDQKISNMRLKASQIAGSIDKNENAIRIDRERIDELTTRSESLAREIEDILKRISQRQENLAKVEAELNVIDVEKENRHTSLGKAEQGLAANAALIKESEKTIADNKLAIMENLSSQSRVRNDLNKIMASLTSASSRHRRLMVEEENINRDISSGGEKFKDVESRYAGQKAAVQKDIQTLRSLKNAYEQLEENSQEKSQAIENLKQRLASSNSKLELFKDLKEKKEGLSEGVKAYMEFIDKNETAKDAFVGIIADMLQPQHGFITALEASLGDKSQLIIVKTRSAVRDALSHLKSSKRGRVQFAALDEISSDPATTAKRPSSVAGALSDFVKVKDKYEQVVRYILKDTYLVDDIDRDRDLRLSGATLVTRDGDLSRGILTAGGSSSGEEYTGIIGRNAKIEQLTAEVEALRKQISEYEAEYAQLIQKRATLQKELAGTEAMTKQGEFALNTIESDRAKIIDEKERLKQEFDLVHLELEEISAEEKGLTAKEQILKEELKALESTHQQIESLINENQNAIKTRSSDKEQLIVTLTELRTQISLIDDRYNLQNATFTILRNSLKEEESAADIRTGQQQEATQRSHELHSEMGRLTEENKVLSSQAEIVNKELAAQQEARKGTFTLVAELDRKIRDKQRELDELRNNISTFHINVTELNYKANTIKERIQQSYKVNLDDEMVAFEGNEDWDKIGLQVRELQEKIEKMGPVNLIAIDEHKELKERYDFLTNQQQDLITAKESLHKAINKINRTTRKMFQDTFEQIQVAFRNYFKLLFGGGTAELFLIDQADILESGIEIVVRPPGKKLQNISLLSGGEKALTATALLFALFKVRPTPFCVLDEIDAPLDEANIDRFSRILQEFIKTTQFIIITHNKKTISVSDIMYGITMEKSGISKIVSVKFSEGRPSRTEQENLAPVAKRAPQDDLLAEDYDDDTDGLLEDEKPAIEAVTDETIPS